MKETLAALSKNSLFEGIDEVDIKRILDCLSARMRSYKKNAFVFRTNDKVELIYILLSGSAHIIEDDFWGNQLIVETLRAPVLFGEAYVLSGAKKHLVSVAAAEDSNILLINPSRLFEKCPNACACHATLIKNISGILSQKVVRLTQKLLHVAQRTTRQKLISYFSTCSAVQKESAFQIPYSRQQLADFLCVERSALSHELSRMQSDGLIRYRKNHFELLKTE